VDSFWSAVCQYRDVQNANGRFAARRQGQAKAWMWERIDAALKQRFRQHPQVQARLGPATDAVLAGTLPASTAARQLLELFD
jgi:LAO/AO transport system kinase